MAVSPSACVLIGCYAFVAVIEGRLERGRVSARMCPRRLRDPAGPWHGCVLSASMAATLANPYGWHVYEYVGADLERAPRAGRSTNGCRPV